jgi:MFS family permease
MTTTDTVTADRAQTTSSHAGDGFLGTWWVLGGFALLLLAALGWRFIADPSLSAPTRDPAWYTWRAQVILDADPASVAGEWGPDNLFSGGYRITTPLAGALLQRVAGIDPYSFSAFLMLGVPILTGLALGAGAFRSRGDPLVVLVTLLASAAFFLTTPYVGYLDNITVLFLLALTLPFLHDARTSWGARTALFLIGVVAAFTHPTTCVVFGVCLMAIFGWHFLTNRFSLGAALRADMPMLMSVGFGMIAGLSCWLIGIWGVTASLAEAALPPPYTAEFFGDRLTEWTESLQPLVLVPLVVIAIASAILLSRRERKPAHTYDQAAIWWLLAYAGALTVLLGGEIPYYRFMNASVAPIALAGLGGFAAIRAAGSREAPSRNVGLAGVALAAFAFAWWFVVGEDVVPLWQPLVVAMLGLLATARAFVPRDRPMDWVRVAAGAAAAALVFGALGGVLWDGLQNRWISDRNQWANQDVRTSLAAVGTVADSAGERPLVLIVNYNDNDDETGTNTTYGWAKTYTNVTRTGLGGDQARYQVTYLGTVENFLAGVPTTSSTGSEDYDAAAASHFCEMVGSAEHPECLDEESPKPVIGRFEAYPQEPAVFVIGQYYKGLCNGGACAGTSEDERLQQDLALGNAIEVGPDTWMLTGDGLWTPPQEVVTSAQAAAASEAGKFANHPSAFADPLHTLRVIGGLILLAVVPGLLAMGWVGARSNADRLAMVPGMSIVLTLLAGIAVLAVWRGPLTSAKGWTVVAVAIGLGAALRLGDVWLRGPLESFGGFFGRLFAVFSNHDFAVLMGVQFLTQAGQGVVQGAIFKSLTFGGQEGFDVQNLPSADYLLKVVLALYVPYTLLSPFIGVFIDRFPRRRVVWWANVLTALIVAGVAIAVLLPLGTDTTEGRAAATVLLIVALIAVQASVRVALAVKSAAIPDVMSGKDLLQGNALSQAGGALFQIFGIVLGGGLAGFVPPWVPALFGAAVIAFGALVAMRLRHAEMRPRDATFVQEASRVLHSIVAGLREVASRAPAALGLLAFQMLRYQFWGFGLFVFGLYGKNLVKGGDADSLALVLSGVGGLMGGALGLVLAQKWKDRVPPIRLLLGAMTLLGIGTLLGGLLVSVAGFAVMLFIGFFSFFMGKIAADTIMQQTMPDDFRGRAFALFDIAYNLGYIVPALILFLIWIEASESATRAILLASGAIFMALTFLVARWARRIADQFAPQDDIVESDLPSNPI